jgi:hypothetical protein
MGRAAFVSTGLAATIATVLLTVGLWVGVSSSAAARDPSLPDPQMTPGDVLPGVTQEQVCQPDYGHDIGPISQQRAEQVLLAYGLLNTDPGAYKIDHLIPLALGGSNNITNLWPLARNAEPWNAYVKDVFERKLHTMICTGGLSLQEVQAALAKDWVAAYWRWIGE